MSSVNGRRGIPGSAVYSATKFAQVGLIEGLRAEQIDTNIHASVVFPVSTRTEFREAARRRFGQEVHGRGPQQSAEVVARAVLRCMREPTPEVYTYAPAKWLAILSVIAPRLADRLATRYERRAR
jgi:short-subunit dehydrogenase